MPLKRGGARRPGSSRALPRTARRVHPEANELAKELNDPSIAKLKKPTAAAWLVNQLAERKPKQVEKLLDAAADLRARQEAVLAGKASAEDLRAASRNEQKAIDALMKTAEVLAREHGSSGQVIDKVGETLRTASSDTELAERIRAGTVVREQRPTATGFEAMPDLPPQKKKDTVADRRKREGEERARRQAERWVERAQKKSSAPARPCAAPNPSSRTPAKSWKTRLAD